MPSPFRTFLLAGLLLAAMPALANADMLGDEERRIVDDVFDAGDRSLREVMVPRTEVDFLAGNIPAYKAIQIVQDAQRSRYPVIEDTPDQVVGFLHVRDLMGMDTATRQTPVNSWRVRC